MKLRGLWVAVVAAVLAGWPQTWIEAQEDGPKQDPEMLRFIERAASWYPDSVFQLTRDQVRQTASGSYRLVTAKRSCASSYLSGLTQMMIDEVTSTAWIGTVGALPTDRNGVELKDLRSFLEGYLPDALLRVMGRKVRVHWDTGDLRPGALIPFHLWVDTGYGEYLKPAAVSADGEFLVLGAPLPLDQDPVEYRRELLRSSPLVTWDHPADSATVEVVEFSDFECPGCRHKWPLIELLLNQFPDKVRHGFVAFPLVTIHPWSFRAASAGWCVADQRPQDLIAIKELFYSLQREMEVAEVTPTAVDFVAANELDEERFLSCYLRPPSLDGVHAQVALGHRLGVSATPTYFVNGWLVQVPEERWLVPMVERLSEGLDP
jgi:protein-disulfide isomerase